jgi:tetrahydromethanopterin S-methyltransferase subunit G
MRLDDLAVRLVAVEAKLASLTGIVANGDAPTNLDDLDARLSVVETTVDHLITEKAQEHIETIVGAIAGGAPVSIDQVVALSPSANDLEASSLVSDVLAGQILSDAVTDTEVAGIVAAAIAAVVSAEPEVVTNPQAITQAIMDAVAEQRAPEFELTKEAVNAVAEIISAVTGVEEVAPKVLAEVAEAIAEPVDPKLDGIEQRLDVAEQKVNGLLGK